MALRAKIQRQTAWHELAFAQLFGVSQGAPRVIECRLYRAGQVFALGQASGQGAGQGAARTMIAAGQTLAGVGVAAAIAAVQAIMHFVFVAMTAGDQQVLDIRQEFFCAFIGRALDRKSVV